MDGNELVRVQKENFSIDEEIARVMKTSKSIGGIASFLGTARDISKGESIEKMEFEHYPGMAEKKLNEIRQKSIDTFSIIETSIVHRVGPIAIGENIVLIVCAATHRNDAFMACEWCITELKRISPIWKKEFTTSGESWVEQHP